VDHEAARYIIADHLGVCVEKVEDRATFRSLGADSLDLVMLTMRFEEAYDVEISETQAEGCDTVGDALHLLEGTLSSTSEIAA
jgi:acyl carrier protein